MARFNIANFMTPTADGKTLSVFSASYKNMRYAVAVERTLLLRPQDEHNLPGIAEKYLGNKELWWVLLEFNGLHDPIHDIKAGNVLLIPSRSSLISYLEATEDTSDTLVL